MLWQTGEMHRGEAWASASVPMIIGGEVAFDRERWREALFEERSKVLKAYSKVFKNILKQIKKH